MAWLTDKSIPAPTIHDDKREHIRLKDKETVQTYVLAKLAWVKELGDGYEAKAKAWTPDECMVRLLDMNLLLVNVKIAKEFGESPAIGREGLADYLEEGGPLTGKMRDYIVELLRTKHRSRTPKKAPDGMYRALAYVEYHAEEFGLTGAVNKAAAVLKVSPRSIWRMLESHPIIDIPSLQEEVAELYVHLTNSP
jgi:hypothetical protein